MKSDRIKDAKRFFALQSKCKNIEWKRIEAHIQKPFCRLNGQECKFNNCKLNRIWRQKKQSKKELAIDVALEIVLGCDRFDRTDLREIIDQEGFDVEEMKQQTKDYIKENFQSKDESGHVAPTDFVEEQLAYWYELWK